MHWIAGAVLATALAGWTDITVERSRSDRPRQDWQRALAELDRPSERTAETLKRYDLERRFRRDPDGALTILERYARRSPEPELVFALAELSWVEGRRLDRHRRPEALDHYLDAAAYAYDFLFDPELEAGRLPSDPRFRLACDLYNGGLDRLIRAAQSEGRVEPGGTIRLKIHGKVQDLRVMLRGSPWTPDDVDELMVASDFEVSGLPATSHQQYGLGVPLIAVRRSEPPRQGGAHFLPAVTAFPLTAFLFPNSRLRNQAADVEQPRECTLDLVDPVKFRTVGQAKIPIDIDLTTPLAYMWSQTDLNRYRWAGLLNPGQAADRSGLMLLRPYEPGKIPVVMVHGLISSPLAWIPMLNELLHDPQIEKNYQFFLYLYPTGVPIPIAAAGLRASLEKAAQTFNPGGRDPAFNQMVLLGHSMGGLLSHAMTVRSGNLFWGLNTDRPFEEIVGPPEVLAELRQYSFFEPLPFVSRVVFLATPHRGSDLSRRMVGRVSSSLISEPDHFSQLLGRLVKDNPDAFNRRHFRHLPTSIETLEPDAPVLMALLQMQPGPGVEYHSIIGSLRADRVETTTDGVVPYRSSHITGPNVKSERVVRSDHGVQKDPEAIIEVRNILKLHLNRARAEVAPAAAMAPR